jgi:transcriptional regulator with XRE-family HTH domain
VAKVLRELPSSFGGSLKYHMEHSTRSGKKKVSSLWLAEETGLSEGYIDQLRNGERRVSLETVCAICIALHLLPPYSKDLIAKSHNGFLNNEEGLFGQQLIEDFYLEPLSDINEVLKEQGFQMWGKTEE